MNIDPIDAENYYTVQSIRDFLERRGFAGRFDLLSAAQAAFQAARLLLSTPASASAPSDDLVERVARLFHENYERLAPKFGYGTRIESAVPWADVPEKNKKLMIATVAAVLSLTIPQPTSGGEKGSDQKILDTPGMSEDTASFLMKHAPAAPSETDEEKAYAGARKYAQDTRADTYGHHEIYLIHFRNAVLGMEERASALIDFLKKRAEVAEAKLAELRKAGNTLIKTWRTACDKVRDPYVCADELSALLKTGGE